ncbi:MULTISPECIES: phytanoyl-CoA dioxygenase family protein [unclassified Minwuia]|jgi:ectoine hydroxylase-related dioxygenase (phytanoyl-CoA dioxygenase family)|uniref:phytanoyl-CoA dioxygenase family protein n=1 Tax=unclassified Minwuia TaxID=2618799 RepID=UPI00247AF473|nr:MULTISPECIES: phytanoyl-CoA dioxygenase family protein [unclassified Minwuia]
MTRFLSEQQVADYQRDGFVFPLRAFAPETADAYRHRLESYEAETGGPIQSNMRHKVHLLFTWASELIRHPRILDAVEDVLGPDILCWSTNFFIKEPGDESFVSWHQDSTYWGLEPPDVVTAWVALSDAPVESGAMKFKPGSHLGGQIAHSDTFHPKNLLTRGQVIDGDLDLSDAVSVPLQAGEFSLHHIRLAHGSEPNRTANRRIGFAIRYIGAHVKPVKAARSATLVRGIDQFGHFDLEQAPVLDLDRNALAAHEHAMKGQLEALYSGTDVETARD